MKLNLVSFGTKDLDQSVRFYTELAKLIVVRRLEVPAGKIAFLADQDGDTMIEIIQFIDEQPHGGNPGVSGVMMSFAADESLESLREKAVNLGYEPSEIRQFGPKPRFFSVKDPNGVDVEFSE